MIIKKRQIARFCSQLRMLLGSGVPLLQSLSIVSNILKDKRYETVIQRISEGESLADAMSGHFPPMVTSSIESAERVGSLEETLGRLARYYEERAEVEDKIKSALIYPCFVLSLCFLSLVILFVFVLPGFKDLFADLGADLPLFTRIIIGSGEVVSNTWYLFVTVGLLGIFIAARFKEKWLLKIRFVSRGQIIQSFKTLGSLLQGGVSITQALDSAANASRIKVFQRIVFEVKEAIENGERLSQVLSNYGIFPQEAIQMIAVGENSGKLGEMLVNIADFYEKEKELFIKRFTSMLEPALTLTVGIVVGIIAIAMFLPMVNMISKLQ
jgi:type IV pilus assembly protein PilC